MRMPRPNTAMERLLRLLEDLGRTDADLPSLNQVAEIIQVAKGSTVSGLLFDGETDGLWRVKRSAFGIVSVAAADGGWFVNGHAARSRVQKVAPRKCLRCRVTFAPEHRTNFLCHGCGIYAARIA